MRRLAPALLAMLAAAPLHAQTSWGVVATPSREIVFCDPQRDNVWRLDTTGRLSVLVPGTHCRTVVLAADGFVYGESVNDSTDSIDANTGGPRGSTM